MAALPDKAPAKPKHPRNVLVLAKAAGFVHSSIPLAAATVEALGRKTGAWNTTVSYEAGVITADNLKQYDLIFGDAFNDFSVPWHLTTREFNEKIAKMMSPTGVYMINIIDVYESDATAKENADKLIGDKNYTIYIDTVLGTAVMQYADPSSATHPYAEDLVAPQPMHSDLPADLKPSRLVIACILDRSGTLRNMQVLDGGGAAMTSKVLAALSSWKFRPVFRGDEAIEVNAILGFNIDTR